MKSYFKKSIVIPAAVLLGVLALFFAFSGGDSAEGEMYHAVERGNLTISVVEGGTLEAVNEVVVKNTIDGESRIIYLIPEGSYVKKGDLLAEFDKGKAESSVQEKQVQYESRQADLIRAENDLIITKSTVDSDTSEADLAVKFATMDLQRFEELEKEHKISESKLKIETEVEANKLALQRYNNSKDLEGQGFETQSQVDRDKLEVSRSSKGVQTAKSTHQMLLRFDLEKSYEEYLSKKKEAEAKLKRVKTQGKSKVAQKQAAVNSAKSTLRLTKEDLDRKQKQLEATKLRAPQDGLVIYAKPRRHWSNQPKIEEGSLIRNRRDVIKIPDVSQMKVEVKIHESVISQVKEKQKAYVVLDSMPDQRFLGEVTKVAILPDSDRSWENPNLKVYTTEVVILDKLGDVKPGVSARAEIIIDKLENVVTVPIQAVTTLDGNQVCYLEGSDEPVVVKVGLFNNQFIEIKSGLKEGQKVSLDPPLDSKLNLTGEGENEPDQGAEEE